MNRFLMIDGDFEAINLYPRCSYSERPLTRKDPPSSLAKTNISGWSTSIARSHDRNSKVKPNLPTQYIRNGQFGPS